MILCTAYCGISSTMLGWPTVDGVKFDHLVNVMIVISLWYNDIYSLQSSVTKLGEGDNTLPLHSFSANDLSIHQWYLKWVLIGSYKIAIF